MLTAKMLLSMHVLQLNIMDLRPFLQAELEENPLLEEEDPVSEATDEDERRIDEEISGLIDDRGDNEELVSGEGNERSSISEEKKSYFESLITEKESLYEHLHWQLEVLAKDEEQKRIGEFLIGNLDDSGYLKVDLKDAPGILNASIEKVRNTLNLVRTFDPAGVAGRDLKESLLIQLINFGKGDTHLYKIVYWHLEDLEKGNFEKIAQALAIPIKEVESAKKRIAYLNPRPGANFGKEVAVRIIPDVFIYKNNGSYGIEINERDLPRLYLSSAYNIALKDKKVAPATKEYVRKKLFHARWVIDAVKQRKNTINRVCEYLVDKQKDFLNEGDSAAKPLTLKEAASVLLVSEATVSRAVSNKYLQAPERLFSLKSFFVKGIKQDSGTVSTMSIKLKIKEFIESEDKARPLKDIEIQSILKDQGINISRRTVAKYRDSLKLPPSNIRERKTDS
ncbi:MAG: RNA polymerase factor sigma-54 [Candidatus Omnitrophica bacterium]|nr:RNA polymerase factor sigma-54 [Candidatus Omnitrophota bacterium]